MLKVCCQMFSAQNQAREEVVLRVVRLRKEDAIWDSMIECFLATT